MGEVTVRREVVDDIEGVVEVLWTVGAEARWVATEVPFDREQRAAAIRKALESDRFAGFVADDAGRVVGSIGLQFEPYGVVEFGMMLLDGYRGQGLGRRLLDAGVEWAREVGAHKVGLQVWPDNERAIALYRSAGFEVEGVLRKHYRRNNGELWDATVMGLILD